MVQIALCTVVTYFNLLQILISGDGEKQSILAKVNETNLLCFNCFCYISQNLVDQYKNRGTGMQKVFYVQFLITRFLQRDFSSFRRMTCWVNSPKARCQEVRDMDKV